jgi:hypothetical protein
VLSHNAQDEHGAENRGKLINVILDHLSNSPTARELLGVWTPWRPTAQ